MHYTIQHLDDIFDDEYPIVYKPVDGSDVAVRRCGDKVIIGYITQDQLPQNPREDYDHLGTMYTKSRKYVLDADAEPVFDDSDDGGKLLEPAIVLPLYIYDHSGQSISTSTFEGLAVHASWDSGLVGYIYVTHAKIREKYGWKRISKKLHDKVVKRLVAEVAEFDQYLRGEVFGVCYQMLQRKETSCQPTDDPDDSFIDTEWDMVDEDTCWGYYGYKETLEEMASGMPNL